MRRKRFPIFPNISGSKKSDFDKPQASYLGNPYDDIERIIVKKGPKIIKLKEKQDFYQEAQAAIKLENQLAEIKK